MGAVASAGGAATSGANISGAEFAMAIVEAAKRDAASFPPTTSRDDGSVADEAIQSENVFEMEYDLSSGGGGGATAPDEDQAAPKTNKKTMRVTSFAPSVFGYLRELERVTTADFVGEWTLPPEMTEPKLGEGRSQAMFLRSRTLNYMCKTIAQAEVDVLQQITGKYAQHIAARPQSPLMRFLMLLKVETNNDTGFILIFGDVFSHATQINERWDIKGRIPKPGKFRSFAPKDGAQTELAGSVSEAVKAADADRCCNEPRQRPKEKAAETEIAEEDENEVPAPVNEDSADPFQTAGATVSLDIREEDDDGQQQGDGDDDEARRKKRAGRHHKRRNSTFMGDGEENPPVSARSKSIRTRKDKELTRVFWLESDVRDALLEDLNADFDFLAGNNLMDYSVLVGVRYNEAEEPTVPEMRQDMHASPIGSFVRHAPAEVRSTTMNGSAVSDAALEAQHELPVPGEHRYSRYHVGVPSVLGEETYFIAIIDMLTFYNGKKMSANFFKSFLWSTQTLSTVPPADYRERISSYVKLVLASPDDDLEEVARLHDST